MSEQIKSGEFHLDEVLGNAIDLTENRLTYVNLVRFHLGINEVILDMYFLGADPKGPGKSAQAQRVLRVVLPLGVAKEISQLLQNGISQWEDAFGITLPLVQSSNLDKQTAPSEGNTNE